jgi:hypothetical protein
MILQDVDNLVIYSPTQEASNVNIIQVLNLLATRGYKESKKKAQIIQQKVHMRSTFSYQGHDNCLRIGSIPFIIWDASNQTTVLLIPGHGRILLSLDSSFWPMAHPLYEVTKAPKWRLLAGLRK